MSLKKHLKTRIIDKTVKDKLVKRLHKVSEIIDEMAHTPSRQCLDEMIVAIHTKLKEFEIED